MTYEQFLKHLPKNKVITREEYEARIRELEGLDLPELKIQHPVPLNVLFGELKRQEEEAKEEREKTRHRELIDVILEKKQAGLAEAEPRQGDIAPWNFSKPKTKERDRIIWEERCSGHGWQKIAEDADCGITTAKENFSKMFSRMKPA